MSCLLRDRRTSQICADASHATTAHTASATVAVQLCSNNRQCGRFHRKRCQYRTSLADGAAHDASRRSQQRLPLLRRPLRPHQRILLLLLAADGRHPPARVPLCSLPSTTHDVALRVSICKACRLDFYKSHCRQRCRIRCHMGQHSTRNAGAAARQLRVAARDAAGCSRSPPHAPSCSLRRRYTGGMYGSTWNALGTRFRACCKINNLNP